MPSLKRIKPPTKERVAGEIFSFEKSEAHKAALKLAKECSDRTTKIRHLIKDPHTNEYYERIQIIHRPRRNQTAS